MRALHTAILYFGSFLALGWFAKRVLDKWMAQHSETLTEIQRQAGENRRKVPRFLLGVWRK
jgi:type II secretory pathway predicted ATPase ExeA